MLERGRITFLYRPRVGVDTRGDDVESRDDVQRLFAILSPDGGAVHRRLTVGRKRLPDVEEHERAWAFVDRVSPRREALLRDLRGYTYLTKTRGLREQPAAEIAGEGSYEIAPHETHVHLGYVLDTPRDLGVVHQELGIYPHASYIAAVRNPVVDAPERGSLPRRRRARYPAHLQERFEERRFVPLDPEYLDHPGAELILIGAREEPTLEAELRG